MWWYHRSSSPTGPLPKNVGLLSNPLGDIGLYMSSCRYTYYHCCKVSRLYKTVRASNGQQYTSSAVQS